MKSLAVCVASGRASLESVELNTPLPEDHLEGRALASAISPGTEVAANFAPADAARAASASGYAMVFEVEAAGSSSGFAPGDRALAMHPHASRVRCAASRAWRLPRGLDPADATLARLAGVSWSTLTTTRARPPARVIVTGLGIVGHLAAQLFAASGYRVLACDPLPERRALLARLGGLETCERLAPEMADWGQQAELVLECSGHEGALLEGCRMVRKGGEVVLVGVPWVKRTELSAHEILHPIFHRYVTLRSGWEWEVPREPAEFRRGSIRENIDGALAWIAEGRLKTTGLYRRIHPRDCQAAYDELRFQRGGFLTAVLDWTLLETA